MSVPVCDEQTQYKDITTESEFYNVNNNLKETDVIAIETLMSIANQDFDKYGNIGKISQSLVNYISLYQGSIQLSNQSSP